MIPPRREGIEDILGLLNPNSLARKPYRGRIILSEHTKLPRFHADDSYRGTRFTIPKEKDALDYFGTLTEICKEARPTGKHERFFAGVYEVFRNAHQHGNKRDPEKNIELNYRLIPDGFEVVVSDEGGDIDSNFLPFVLMHRQGMVRPYSFYDFAPGTTRLEENSGTGTFVVHLSTDEVNYFANYAGGLSVQMIVRKSAKQD